MANAPSIEIPAMIERAQVEVATGSPIADTSGLNRSTAASSASLAPEIASRKSGKRINKAVTAPMAM